jgi:hypothetical protein
MVRWDRAVLCVALAGAGYAHAQPAGTFKCVDESGRSTYTNVKDEMAGKKCAMVSREVSVVPAQQPAAGKAKPPAAANPANSTFSRAADRRKILEEELSDEEKRLADARGKLAEQQSLRGRRGAAREEHRPTAAGTERHPLTRSIRSTLCGPPARAAAGSQC